MTSLAQFLLVVVITTLTILIAIVAVQVWQILFEVKQGIKKFNKILDNTHTLAEASAKPIASVNQFFAEVRNLVDHTEEEIIAQTPDRVMTISEQKQEEPKRNFFRRSGLPLRPS